MLKTKLSQKGYYIPDFKGPQVKKYPAIFFESYSYLKALLLVKEIYTAGTILFMRHGLGMSRQTLKKKILCSLIKLLNPGAEVREISMKEMAPDNYYLNRKAAEVTDKLGSNIKLSKAYCLLTDIVRHEKVLDFYKGCLAPEVGKSLLFYNLSDRILRTENPVIVIPDSLDTLKEGLSDEVYRRLIQCVPNLGKIAITAAKGIEIAAWFFGILLYPLYLLIKHLQNGFSQTANKNFKVAIPVIWGINSDANECLRGGVKRFIDDTYLYGRYFSPGEVLHIFMDDWIKQENSDFIQTCKKSMNERGISFVERNGYRVTGNIFRLTLLTMTKIVKNLFRSGFSSPFNHGIWKATAKGVKHFLITHYEMENTNYQVELVRNDYNPGHIISTIVANRYGRIRVGVAHAASPYDAPQMCFIHLDRYAVFCGLYARLFNPFWDKLRLEHIERETLDSIRNESQRSCENRKKIESLYGKKKWTILILLPGIADRAIPEQWDKIYRALVEFKTLSLDCHLFLRFRRVNQARQYPHMSRFLELPDEDQRIIADHKNFNTHELMSASDLIIAAAASFAINEALFAKIPVFTFSYTLKEHLYFPDYGSEFILEDSKDVLSSIKGLETGFEKFDCDWERLRKDIEYLGGEGNVLQLDELLYRVLLNFHSEREINSQVC